jgi:hypothetical protein
MKSGMDAGEILSVVPGDALRGWVECHLIGWTLIFPRNSFAMQALEVIARICIFPAEKRENRFDIA